VFPSIFYTFKYEMQEKISSTSNFFGSQRGFPFFTAFLFPVVPLAVFLPPTAALKINDALSTNILVTSSADLVYMAVDKSVIYTAG
jgi:hypothetical protein